MSKSQYFAVSDFMTKMCDFILTTKVEILQNARFYSKYSCLFDYLFNIAVIQTFAVLC